MNSQKILITGATGFIGSALVLNLVKNLKVQPEDIVLILRKRPHFENSILAKRFLSENLNAHEILSAMTYVEADFEDQAKFSEALERLGAQLKGKTFTLFHLAAVIKAKGEGAHKIQERMNFGVTKDLLKFCEKWGAKSFVYLSSVVAWGATLSEKVRTEKDFVNFSFFSKALSYYQTKRMAHEYVQNFVCKVPRLVFCPSVVHGALEKEKDSRTHLRALENGKLRWAPRGVLNIVSLSRVVEEISSTLTLNTLPSYKCRLLVEENFRIQDYFQVYANLYGKKQKIKKLPWILSPLVIGFAYLAAILKIPLAYSLQGLVAATGNLKFESEHNFISKPKTLDEILNSISG